MSDSEDSDNVTVLTIPPIPEKVAAAIRRQLPRVSLEEVEDAAHAFFVMPFMELSDPKVERDALKGVGEITYILIELMGKLGPESRQKLDARLRSAGAPGFKNIRHGLRVLSEASGSVASEILPPKGRPKTLKRHLVRDLARILEAANYPVDSSPGGPMVYLTTEILYWLLGGDVGDVRSLVRNTLSI